MGFWILRGYSTEGRKLRARGAGAARRAGVAMSPMRTRSTSAPHWPTARATTSRRSRCSRRASSCGGGSASPSTSRRRCRRCRSCGCRPAMPDGAPPARAEALEIFRGLDDRIGEAIGLLHLGQIHAYVGDDARRRGSTSSNASRSPARSSNPGDRERMRAHARRARARGWRPASARAPASHARWTVCREAGDKRGEANAAVVAGRSTCRRRSRVGARVRLGGALRAFHAFEMHEELLGCLEDHAKLLEAMDSGDDAVRLFAAAAAARDRLALPRPPRVERRLRGEIAAIRERIGAAAFDAAWVRGSTWEIGEAIACALASVAKEAAII